MVDSEWAWVRLPKGMLIHIEGIPVVLDRVHRVLTHPGNVPRVLQAVGNERLRRDAERAKWKAAELQRRRSAPGQENA